MWYQSNLAWHHLPTIRGFGLVFAALHVWMCVLDSLCCICVCASAASDLYCSMLHKVSRNKPFNIWQWGDLSAQDGPLILDFGYRAERESQSTPLNDIFTMPCLCMCLHECVFVYANREVSWLRQTHQLQKKNSCVRSFKMYCTHVGLILDDRIYVEKLEGQWQWEKEDK